MTQLTFDIKSNADLTADFLNEVAMRQIPYAARRTVNDLAFLVRDATYDEMRDLFHKPTPKFTLKSMFVEKVRKDADPISATVHLSDVREWERALTHQFTGGERRYKRMEGAFKRIGILLGDKIMIPADGCPLDAYDNPKPSFIVQLLAYFEAFGQQGYKANMTARSKAAFHRKISKQALGANIEYFVSMGKGVPNRFSGKTDKLPAGIWQRIRFGAIGESRIVPVFLFVGKAHYRRLIRLPELAREVVDTSVNKTFMSNLAQAMNSDRQYMRAVNG